MKTKNQYLNTEEACAMPDPEYDEYRNKIEDMANDEQYRKNTERMHWLNGKWQPVYKKVTGDDSPPF